MTGTLTGRGVLIWLIGFFGLIFATNAFFITLSFKTFRGEDEQKPYLQGIEYNDTLARRAEQARLGWHAAASAQRQASGHVSVDVQLRDRLGRPVIGVPLTVELRHPADENRDRQLTLRMTDQGRYEANAGALSAGYWDLVVLSKSAQTPFEATRRLWIP